MSDDTEIITKQDIPTKREDHGGTSHFFQVSVRAWLAISLILTVCLYSFAQVLIAVYIVLHTPSTPLETIEKLLKVGEPIYTMAGMALAYYFGQQKVKST